MRGVPSHREGVKSAGRVDAWGVWRNLAWRWALRLLIPTHFVHLEPGPIRPAPSDLSSPDMGGRKNGVAMEHRGILATQRLGGAHGGEGRNVSVAVCLSETGLVDSLDQE